MQKTRFPELLLDQVAPGDWRFACAEMRRHVGARYASKAEALADLERYYYAAWAGAAARSQTPPAPFAELLESLLDLRAAVAFRDGPPDLDAAKARADAALDAVAEAGFRVVIAPARAERTRRELDAGLGAWVRDLIAARRAGNVTLAKRLRDDIRARCQSLDLDESAVFFAFGDPDAPAPSKAEA